jgi:hypothetical protein
VTVTPPPQVAARAASHIDCRRRAAQHGPQGGAAARRRRREGHQLQPIDTAGAAFGWALIAAAFLACWFGVPFLIGLLARSISAPLERQRLERERIEEELDERLREELLAIADEESRTAQTRPADAPRSDSHS